MKERGIIFTAESVRAILAGTKSQTRRICKLFGCEVVEERDDGVPSVWSPQHDGWIACPYGFAGDRIHVKETFAALCREADPCCSCDDEDKARNHYVEYRADLAPGCTNRPGGWPRSPVDAEAPRWKSPRFMPRAASRITLELTGVRVERLQSITEADAKAEGMAPAPFCRAGRAPGLEHVEAYEDLWDAINAKRAPWASNPWCWVLSFQRVTP